MQISSPGFVIIIFIKKELNISVLFSGKRKFIRHNFGIISLKYIQL